MMSRNNSFLIPLSKILRLYKSRRAAKVEGDYKGQSPLFHHNSLLFRKSDLVRVIGMALGSTSKVSAEKIQGKHMVDNVVCWMIQFLAGLVLK